MSILINSIEKLSENFRYLTYISVHILYTQFLLLNVTAIVDAKLGQITKFIFLIMYKAVSSIKLYFCS